jgi:hypothetical protein
MVEDGGGRTTMTRKQLAETGGQEVGVKMTNNLV